jgi:uncharacterized protein YdiU (UPF0061 family)
MYSRRTGPSAARPSPRRENGAYGNQPRIAQWNLARLAETFLPLLLKVRCSSPTAVAKICNMIRSLHVN